jgi:hypothetical protein
MGIRKNATFAVLFLLGHAASVAQTADPARTSQATESQSKTQSVSLSAFLHNDRLKIFTLNDYPVVGDSLSRYVAGVWLPESKDPTKSLAMPQQVTISCNKAEKTCTEISITLAPTPVSVAVQDIDEEEYAVDSWDAHGLVASYGGDEDSASKCQRHVMTMDFDSGAVSVSDIPTHRKSCEMFIETNSYRLQRGYYYVDTTPNNDADVPYTQRKRAPERK